MAEAARLIEGAARPVLRARFAPLKPEPEKDAFPWHKAKWAALSSNLLWNGDRRMEAETYLSSGYGIRLAIEEKRKGWMPLGALVEINHPGRFKSILVSPEYGVPFLSATQAFDARAPGAPEMALTAKDGNCRPVTSIRKHDSDNPLWQRGKGHHCNKTPDRIAGVGRSVARKGC